MLTPILAAACLWGAWLASWLIAAFWSSRSVSRQPRWQRLGQLALFGAGAVLLFGHPASPRLARDPLLPLPGWASWCALGLVAAGFAYAWWARLHLGRLWSGEVALKREHALVRTGPYRLTRHPIYTGLSLSLLGTAIIQDEPAAIAGFLIVVAGLLVKIRQEERLLGSHFGVLYHQYRASVPALIPRPWRIRIRTAGR